MRKLRFHKDEGTEFYKDLTATLDAYFRDNHIGKEGNRVMYFKIGMYFGFVILFYTLMLTSGSLAVFYIFYL